MKIKKVEIQAFRAYDKPEDGVFDFAIKGGEEIANLVSIYAPNGFGKTSFYDAVEYGMTKNIGRLIKKRAFNDNAAKSERNIGAKKKQFILRNRYSDDELDSTIKIYTNGEKTPISTKIALPKIKGSNDFPFSKTVENEYFQTVILSQEWIDAFLTEDDPSERYDKFMRFFGDVDLDEYYKKLVNLLLQNEKRIQELSTEYAGEQKKIDYSGDKKILINVNSKITDLQGLGEKIKTIDISYNKDESLLLSDTIVTRLNDYTFENSKINNHIEIINSLYSGNIDSSGVKLYFKQRERIVELVNNEQLINDRISAFKDRQKLENEVVSISKSQKKVTSSRDVFSAKVLQFEEYEKSLKKIKTKEEEFGGLQESISAFVVEISSLKDNENELNVKISTSRRKIVSLNEKLLQAPEIDIEDGVNSKGFLTIKDEGEKLEIRSEVQKSDLVLKKIELKSIENALRNIAIDIFPSEFDKLFTAYSAEIQILEEKRSKRKEKEEKLVQINWDIKNQKDYASDLAGFISKGAQIIDKNDSSACPLCEHEYESFKDLSDRVNNNSFLSEVLSNLIMKRTEVENELTEIRKKEELEKSSFKKLLNEDVAKNEKEVRILEDSAKEIDKLRQELSKRLILCEKKDSEIRTFFNNLSLEEFKTITKTQLLELDEEANLAQESLDKSVTKKDGKNETLEVLRTKLEEASVVLNSLKDDKSHLAIIEFFNENYPNSEIQKSLLLEELVSIKESLIDSLLREEEIKGLMTKLDIELASYKLEEQIGDLTTLEKEKDAIEKLSTQFELKLKTEFNIDAKEFVESSLKERLTKELHKSQEQIAENNNAEKLYKLVQELKVNVEPFLEYEKAKKKSKEIKRRWDYLKKVVKKRLELEKANVSEYLDKQIETFFYEDLINDLYRRIDPHPDYSTIKFKCDFHDDKPKLNVCLYEEGSEDPIIPNLYFSTAQLNILSLSIFLAKALNTVDKDKKPVDCIFIDDPIQSMDSINILSTIDLLRSIVVNENKQIIISTHDENFHNLLKKKMPKKLFKSKFIELETFGKVKAQDEEEVE
jgi:exonuclease SbcC